MKRVFLMPVCFGLIMAFCPAYAYTAELPAGVSDGRRAGEILAALSVGISGGAASDSAVTRGETAEAAVKLQGISHLLSDLGNYGAKKYFSDVPVNSDKAAYINLAYEAGLMNGESGLFRPNSPVTAREFAAVLVRALGYSVKAEALGGYPNGYYSVAVSLGLFSGGLAQTGEVIRENADMMLLNALEADLMTPSYGTAQTEYTVEKGNTLLKTRWDIDVVNGIVDANATTGLYGENMATAENGISIDGKKYITKLENAAPSCAPLQVCGDFVAFKLQFVHLKLMELTLRILANLLNCISQLTV
jgi:hypothetical protein